LRRKERIVSLWIDLNQKTKVMDKIIQKLKELGERVSAWDKDAPKIPPQIVVAKEHYNRFVRMIEQGEKLKMVVDISAQFHDDDLLAYNTIAEIPGSDLKDEVVMLGGHLDSWHSGTGATDNAAGVSVAMAAVRILEALDLKPRRTIRIGLWSGEEQGLFGSRAYVAQHFGKASDPMAAMMGTPEASSDKKDASNGKPASTGAGRASQHPEAGTGTLLARGARRRPSRRPPAGRPLPSAARRSDPDLRRSTPVQAHARSSPPSSIPLGAPVPV